MKGLFGEINIDGPDVGKVSGTTQELGLKFKFVNRDTGAPVVIDWMQFSVFDFDEEPAGVGREARDTPPCPRPTHRGALTPSPDWVTRFAVRESHGGVRRLRDLLRPGRGRFHLRSLRFQREQRQ